MSNHDKGLKHLADSPRTSDFKERFDALLEELRFALEMEPPLHMQNEPQRDSAHA